EEVQLATSVDTSKLDPHETKIPQGEKRTDSTTTHPPPAPAGAQPPPAPQPPKSKPPAEERPIPKALPAQFGKFKILRRLGGGGMGTVYEAVDTLLERRIALKIPHFSADSSEALARFSQEAKAEANLRHPNICTVYENGVIDGIPYLAMAFIDGQPLTALIPQ